MSGPGTAAGRARAQAGEWTVRGRPLDDEELRGRLGAALEAAREVCGSQAGADDAALGDVGAAEEAIERALGELDERLDGGGREREALGALRELLDLREWLRASRMVRRQRSFLDVQAALARLREIETTDRMVQTIPREVCRCGFDRAMLSRVEDSVWTVESFHVEGDPDWAAELVEVGRRHGARVDHLVLESEMVRRSGPLLVEDAQSEPLIHPELGQATDTRSYVAAPLMPEGRVIGFVHADCYMQRRHVDAFDRDVLGMLAEGIGYAFERTVLTERLLSLRGAVGQLTESIGTTLDSVCAAQVDFARLDLRSAQASRPGLAGLLVEPESPLSLLLTRRELEIVRLMADGETNAAIADKLVIAPGTVKTHVKHILRKLRAANRTEAVSRFVALTEKQRPRGGTR